MMSETDYPVAQTGIKNHDDERGETNQSAQESISYEWNENVKSNIRHFNQLRLLDGLQCTRIPLYFIASFLSIGRTLFLC